MLENLINKNLFIRGIFYILTSLIIFIFKEQLSNLFSKVLIVIGFIYATIIIWDWYNDRNEKDYKKLIIGLLVFSVSVFMLFSVSNTVSILTLVISGFFILDGVSKLKNKEESEPLVKILGIVIPIISGIFFVIFKITTMEQLMVLFAIFLFVNGLINVNIIQIIINVLRKE